MHPRLRPDHAEGIRLLNVQVTEPQPTPQPEPPPPSLFSAVANSSSSRALLLHSPPLLHKTKA